MSKPVWVPSQREYWNFGAARCQRGITCHATGVSADESLWPEDFWWGTGASSTQCEGAAPQSDWARWEQLGRAPASGDGNGFATRYAEDFALYAEHGLAHHRLSLDWNRLEPQQGHHPEQEVERYRAILQAGRDAGLSIWVCLHHFTLPGWFADDLHGFHDDKNGRLLWSRHADWVGETFGDLVAGWKPINEPSFYAVGGNVLGAIPPGRRDRRGAMAVLGTIHQAAADAAKLLRTPSTPTAT